MRRVFTRRYKIGRPSGALVERLEAEIIFLSDITGLVFVRNTQDKYQHPSFRLLGKGIDTFTSYTRSEVRPLQAHKQREGVL